MKHAPLIHVIVHNFFLRLWSHDLVRMYAQSLRIMTMLCFFSTSIQGPLPSYASDIMLPKPGVMVSLSPPYHSPTLKGITVFPDNPFKFDFILDQGDTPEKLSGSTDEELKVESKKLVKYFLAAITTPEEDLWVNLSPYEKDRIIPESFGQTDMGRDLLAQDYLLKQITASLIYPEEALGQAFWKRVYAEALKKFKTTQIPVNTFNKVWIVPDHAKIYEHGNTAYIIKSSLKVMLEEDYLATTKNHSQPGDMFQKEQQNVSSSPLPTSQPMQMKASQGNNQKPNNITSQIIREIIIPQLEQEVNEGKNFAPLRQIYNSLILAVWFKKKMKESLLGHKYVDQNKIEGIQRQEPDDVNAIYQRYLQAFKKGVYNYIKEEPDLKTQMMIPRKYFSGGFKFAANRIEYSPTIRTEEVISNPKEVKVNLGNQAMAADNSREAVTEQQRDEYLKIKAIRSIYHLSSELFFFVQLQALRNKKKVPILDLNKESQEIPLTEMLELFAQGKNFESQGRFVQTKGGSQSDMMVIEDLNIRNRSLEELKNIVDQHEQKIGMLSNKLNLTQNEAMNTFISNANITPGFLEMWKEGEDVLAQDEGRDPYILPAISFPKSLEENPIEVIHSRFGRVNIIDFNPITQPHGTFTIKFIGGGGMNFQNRSFYQKELAHLNHINLKPEEMHVPFHPTDQIYLLNSLAAKDLMKKMAREMYDEKLVPYIFGFSLFRERIQAGKEIGQYYKNIYEDVLREENITDQRTIQDIFRHIFFKISNAKGTLAQGLTIAKKAMIRVYQETGEDLVKAGVLSSLSSKTPYAWPVNFSGTHRFPNMQYVDWVSDQYFRRWLWEHGLDTVFTASTDQELNLQYQKAIVHKSSMFLGRYFSKKYHPKEYASDPLTRDIIEMKKVRSKEDAKPIIIKRKDEIKKIIGTEGQIIMPIPKKNQKQNHMAYVAEALGEELNMEVQLTSLTQIKKADEQKTLDNWERLENVIHVFDIPNKKLVKGKTIILIDDVYSSGATIESARDALYKADAKKVIIFAFGATREYKERDSNELVEDEGSLGIDQAENTQSPTGGIDFTPHRLTMDIEKDKSTITQQPLDLKSLEHIEINGLYIKDIEIKPLTNLPQMLGLN